MDSHTNKSRLNWKIIGIAVVTVILLVAGGAIGVKVRRQSMISSAYDRAHKAVAEKRWPTACREFRYYLSKNKQDHDARLQYARACLLVDPPQLSNAANAYRFVLQKNPGDRDLSRRLATLYYRGRDFDDAAYICRQRLAKDPSDDDAAMLLGETLVSQGSFAEADSLLRSLIERNPAYPDAYVLLSSLAVQRDPRDGPKLAGQWLDRAVDANPQSAKALAYRARYRRTVLRDYEGAREDLTRAVAHPPTDPWAMLLMIEQWTELGELDRAARSLDQVKSLDRDELIDRELILVTFDLAQFITEARLVMELESDDRSVQLADHARERFDAAQLYAVLPTITELYLRANRIDLAREMIREFSGDQDSPDFAKVGAQRNLSVCAAMIETAQNRWHQTINTLEPLTEAGLIQDQKTWSLLGRAYDETDQTNRAVNAWERAFALGSVSTETAERLVRACLSRDLIKGYRIATSTLHRSADSFDSKLLQTEVLVSAAVLGWVAPDLVVTMKSDLNEWATQHPKNGRIRILQAALAASENKSDEVVALLNTVLADCDRKREALNSLVTYHISRGNLDDAIESCRNAISLVGNLADPHMFLARILAGSGQFEEARSVLTNAATTLEGQEQFNVQTALADLLIQYAKRDEAINLLLQLTREHSDNVHIRAELLKIPAIQQNQQLASSLLNELREIEGDRGLKWRFAEALMHLASSDWDKYAQQTESLLNQCIRSDSTWPEPVLALASLYERTDQPEQAEQVYRRHFDQHPHHLDIAGKLLELLERERKYAEADGILQRVPRELADMSGHRVNIAIGRGKYDEAIAELQQRRESDPQDAVSRLILAELLYQIHRDAATAFALLDEAEQLKPDMRSVISAKLDLLRAEGRIDDATRIANQQVESYGDFAAHLMRASHFHACGRANDAEQDFKRLIEFEQQQTAGYLALGNFYFKSQRLDQAIATWRKGLTVLPDDVGLTHRLIEALLAHSDQAARDEGRRILDDGLLAFPEDTVLLHLRATDLLRRRTAQTHREAVAILERIVNTDSRNIKAFLQLVQLAAESGRREDASNLVNQALGANPGSDALLLARAGLEREQGHLRLARSLAASVLDVSPDNLPAQVILAEIAVADGDYDEADDRIANVLRTDPTNESANLLRARLLREKVGPERAIESLTEFCDTPAGRLSTSAHAALARLLIEQGNLTAAAKILSKAVAASGESLNVFQARLEWLAASDRFDEIVSVIDGRIESGFLPPALVTFAGQLMLRSQRDELLPAAMKLFDRVIASNGHPLDMRDAQVAKAQVAYRLNDIEQSVQCYRNALNLDPFHNRALNNLSWILSEESDRPHEAVPFVDRGVARYPDDANLLDTRAIILHRLKRFEQAKTDLQRCVALCEDNPTMKAKALIHLARVLIELGDNATAIKHLDDSLEIDRHDPVLDDDLRKEAHQLLARIR